MGLFPVSEQQAIPYRLNGKSDDFSDTFHSTVSCTLSSDDYRKKANWQLIRDDMILDNQYLTDILEKGRYPARIPPEQIRNISPRELMEGVTGR